VAVFDTAFHRTIPDHAGLYAIPLDLSRKWQIQRYGFHGTSHKYVSGQLLSKLGKSASGTRLITCHLGNGASICAIRDGKSVDTSMGLTPLEGLIMGTRSGDLDPALVLYLIRTVGMSADQVDHLLNNESGLLGLGGHSDMRDIQGNAEKGDERSVLALDAFSYRIREYIGAYAAALGGLDAVAFTGGIGEHAPAVRARILTGMEWLGLRLDQARNSSAVGKGSERISADDSPVPLWVIPTDEELQIARETSERVRS
jgi:acetate kinase